MQDPVLKQLKRLKKTLRDKPRSVVARPSPCEPDEQALFRQAMQGVVPLVHQRHVFPPRPVSPWPRARENEQAQNMAENLSDYWPWDELIHGEELLFMRPGVQHEVVRKLRRGESLAQAELDLHGHSSDSARLILSQFLMQCRQHNLRYVRIIHGKGLSSPNREPILKLRLKNWLAQHEDVLAFCQARPAEGGAGAALVLLKSRKKH